MNIIKWSEEAIVKAVKRKMGLIHVPFPNASLCSHIVSAVQMQSLLLTQKTKPGNELGMTALV